MSRPPKRTPAAQYVPSRKAPAPSPSVRISPVDSSVAKSHAGVLGIAQEGQYEESRRRVAAERAADARKNTSFTPSMQRSIRKAEGFEDPQYHIKGGGDLEVSELTKHLPGYRPVRRGQYGKVK